MANKVTIDVEARFVDEVTAESKAASSAVEKIGKSAETAQKQVDKLSKKKVKPIFDADNSKMLRKLREMESKASSISKPKKVVISAVDKATRVLGNIANKAQSIAGKTYSAIVKVKDSEALSSLKQIGELGRGIAGKTWRAIVKITDYATTPLRALKNTLFSIKTLVTAIVAGVAAKTLLAAPVELADAYTSAKIGFSTLLGETSGQKMMDDLDAFAKATPFKTSQVIANSQKMLAMGWDAENIITDMKTIGDAAAATGKGDEGLSRIILALSQIKSKGKLSTEELNQLAEAGISAKRYIAEGLGYGSGDAGLMKMTKELENGAIGAEAGINAIIEGMKEYDGMMDKTANETVKGLWGQIEDTFEINILRKWGQGLQDGAKKGFGSIVNLLDTADDALSGFGDTVYGIGKELSNWAALKLNSVVKQIKEVTDSEDFKNASLGGKVGMLWTKIVSNPFAEWWQSTVIPWWDNTATPWLAGKAATIGTAIGKGLTGGLLAILGVDATGAVEDGASIAGSFVKGFTDGFDGSAITQAFVDAISNVWNNLPAWAKILIGGYGAGKVAGGIGNFIGGVKNFGSMAAPLIGSTGNAMVGGTGIAGGLANAGYLLKGGYAANAGLGGAAAAGIGAAGIAGGVAGAAALISGISDFINAKNQATEEEKSAYQKSGAFKVGGVAAGAAAGAAIGSVVPILGTAVGALVGAGVGGVGGWLAGNKAKEKAEEAAGSVEDLAKAEYEAAQRAKELAAVDMAEHFGKVTLAANDLKAAANNLVGQDILDTFNGAADAISGMAASLTNFDNAEATLKKDLWMTTTKNGAKLTDEEINTLNTTLASFSEAAQTYATDAKYASETAIKALIADEDAAKAVLEASGAFYKEQGDQITSLTKELQETLTEALSDNVISVDEEASLQKIRQQIAEITRQIQNEEYEADMNIIKAKYGGDSISLSSFKDLVNQSVLTAETAAESIWETFGAGSIGIKEGSAEWQALLQGTMDSLSATWDDVGAFGLDTLRSNWSEELGLLGSDFATMMQENTVPEIVSAASALPEAARASVGAMIEAMSPTTEQIQHLADKYTAMGLEIPEALQEYLNSVEFYAALAEGPKKVQELLGADIEANPTVTIKPTTKLVPLSLTASSLGINSSYNFSPTVSVNPLLKPIGGKATGGIVGGGEQIIRVAEEGPEMIIPLVGSRRQRGLNLWKQTGSMLGVPGFANGGITRDEGIRFNQYDAEAGGNTVQVDVGGVTVEINVGSAGGNVAEAIRAQAGEIAETVAGILADAFAGQFENTPLRGGTTA